MAGIEKKKKIVPLITCEILFSQHVCESLHHSVLINVFDRITA